MGESDFTDGGNRIKTLVKGVGKREVPNANRPFNIELSGWVGKSGETSTLGPKESDRLFVAAVVGFFFLLRISELANLKFGDLVFENTPVGDD